MFVTLLWTVQSYPIEKGVFGVTLHTSKEALHHKINGLITTFNEKQIYWTDAGLQMWPSILTLAMTLTLNFQGQIANLLYLRKNGLIAMKRK